MEGLGLIGLLACGSGPGSLLGRASTFFFAPFTFSLSFGRGEGRFGRFEENAKATWGS